MAVYEHKYKPYEGQLTPEWSRSLVIPRHAWRSVFASKLLTGFFAICFICPLVFAILIYLRYNASALALLEVSPESLAPVNANFFRIFLNIQSGLAFVMTVLVGPALISRDLANNALPLYLCRPFSRVEYIWGKALVLLALISAVTWVPGLLLFAFQSYLAGSAWISDQGWVGGAILLSSLTWAALLTLLALALSALIRWRIAASGAIFAIFVIPAAVTTFVTALFRTPWPQLFNPGMLMKVVVDSLFGHDLSLDLERWMILPATAAWAGLGGIVLLCLWLLARKVRAYEVIT